MLLLTHTTYIVITSDQTWWLAQRLDRLGLGNQTLGPHSIFVDTSPSNLSHPPLGTISGVSSLLIGCENNLKRLKSSHLCLLYLVSPRLISCENNWSSLNPLIYVYFSWHNWCMPCMTTWLIIWLQLISLSKVHSLCQTSKLCLSKVQ